MRAGTVIVGTGQAGFQTAASLRTEGYQEPISLVGEEPHIPYQRPPLSKGFQLEQQDFQSILFRPESFYREHAIRLLTGTKVERIEYAERRVKIASGAPLPYDKLVLAVGARNRALSVPGSELDGIVYLRSLDEASQLQTRLKGAREIVVIGGGFIGLEVAAVARGLGKSVTVVEALPRLMSRVVAPIISDFYQSLHASKGVNVVCGGCVSEFAGPGGKVGHVVLKDGGSYPADLVVVGIGVVPNVELARDAGLAVANGIAVNEILETDGANIFAIGDCAEHPCSFAGARIRLESVQNAADQAQCVAATIAGRRESYRALPWFWTEQYEVKLQMAGISQGHDQVVLRGNSEARKFSVFYFKKNRIVAIDSINRPLDHIVGRKLMAAGAQITPEQAADESVDLRKLEHAIGRHAFHPSAH